VSFAEGAAFAQKYNIKFFETSAKTAQNVEEAFLSTANIILDNIERNEYDLSNEVGADYFLKQLYSRASASNQEMHYRLTLYKEPTINRRGLQVGLIYPLTLANNRYQTLKIRVMEEDTDLTRLVADRNVLLTFSVNNNLPKLCTSIISLSHSSFIP